MEMEMKREREKGKERENDMKWKERVAYIGVRSNQQGHQPIRKDGTEELDPRGHGCTRDK